MAIHPQPPPSLPASNRFYLVGFALTAVTTWVLKDTGGEFLAGSVAGFKYCAQDASTRDLCVSKEVALRIGFGNFLYFMFNTLVLIRMKYEGDPRVPVHGGLWLWKVRFSAPAAGKLAGCAIRPCACPREAAPAGGHVASARVSQRACVSAQRGARAGRVLPQRPLLAAGSLGALGLVAGPSCRRQPCQTTFVRPLSALCRQLGVTASWALLPAAVRHNS